MKDRRAMCQLLGVATLLAAWGCTTDSASAPLSGLWHLAEGQIDSTNLRIDADGTFRWGIDGCDFLGGGRGVWHTVGQTVVLAPAAGESTFHWVGEWSFANPVNAVRLARSGTEITASLTLDGQPVVQRWQAGGECPACGNALGPVGPGQVCTDPFLP